MTDFLAEISGRYISPQAVLIKTATEKVLADLKINSVDELKRRFDEVLVAIEVETYRLYLVDEKKMVVETVRDLGLGRLAGPGPYAREKVADIADGVADDLARLFMHLGRRGEVRPARHHSNLRGLIRRLDYPFDEQVVINGQPDFLMPGEPLFRQNPSECIILTAKRTLRERWRQITTEGKHFRLFLATIDDRVSPNQLAEMLKQSVYLVVPKKKIEAIPAYRDAENVISFDEFFGTSSTLR